MISIRNLRIERDHRVILDIPSLDLREGEHTAILGPNGSGKTTLLKVLAQSITSNPGASISLFGRPSWDAFELRKLLGLVSTDLQTSFTFNPNLSAREIVLTGYFAGLPHRPKDITPEMEERADQALLDVGAGDLSGKKMQRLSLGEARKVVIARALVSRPKMLLLDEPSTGLDFAARHHFLQALRGVSAHTTLLIVTHDLCDLIPELQRMILLKDGQIHTDGNPAEVKTDANLLSVFGAVPSGV